MQLLTYHYVLYNSRTPVVNELMVAAIAQKVVLENKRHNTYEHVFLKFIVDPISWIVWEAVRKIFLCF